MTLKEAKLRSAFFRLLEDYQKLHEESGLNGGDFCARCPLFDGNNYCEAMYMDETFDGELILEHDHYRCAELILQAYME